MLHFTDYISLSALRMACLSVSICLRLSSLVFFISHIAQLLADYLFIGKRLPKDFDG